MKVSELICHLEERVPLAQQEDFDNCGVQCGDVSIDLKNVLVAIDITEAVVNEAIVKGCNLIVTHHPALFRATKQITPGYYIHRALINAIKHDIVIYAAHTSLDNDDEGINMYWASKMGLSDIRILDPIEEDSNIGMGVLGDLDKPVTINELIQRMQTFQPITHVAHSTIVTERIQKIAYCGGSGAFLMGKAAKEGADIFITGEAKYNDYYDAEGQITLMTIGHFESELLSKDILRGIMSEKKGNFAIYNSESCINPVHYISKLDVESYG